ncbi:MAG: methyltransferase domain-containing protein [Pseudomonadota bacterium]
MTASSEVKSEKLKDVYGKNRSVDDQRQIYREWAQTYDEQTTKELGWMGFKPAAEAFAARVTNKDARILDAGCGTGLSGSALADLGYKNIHGKDLSPEMLAIAEKTGAYQTLGEVDLTKPIPIEEPFDAVFSCGVFGFGPPHTEHLPHLVKAAKPGGLVILTVNGKGWADMDWETKLQTVVSDHELNLEEQLEIEYLEKEGINGKLLVFRS